MNLEIIKDSIQKKLLGKSEKMAGSPEPEVKPDFLKILNELITGECFQLLACYLMIHLC